MIRQRLIISLLAAMWLHVGSILAEPAWSEPVSVQQPDGTTLTVRLHGDEYLHYLTTTDGYTVVKNANGYYVYAEGQAGGDLVGSSRIAHDAEQRTADEEAWLASIGKHLRPTMSESNRRLKAATAKGRQQTLERRRLHGHPVVGQDFYSNFKGLILLAEFNDCPFQPNFRNVLEDMVNKRNYTGYDSTPYGQFTGSVRDYFYDNTNQQFDPQFFITNPIKIDKSMYEGGGSSETGIFLQLIETVLFTADSEVDFSQFDSDKDGVVDMVYVIFSGFPANWGDNDKRRVWPQQAFLGQLAYVNDGVKIDCFACSTELVGDEKGDKKFNGIGTICHEFSHALGLPDLYDTDYEEGGGLSNHPGVWSIMAAGNQIDYGRHPAGYGLYERYSLGFAHPQVLNAGGCFKLFPLGESNTGYRINSAVEDEFFLLEYRHPGCKWDKGLPGRGMLVFRVDSTDHDVWEKNHVNCDPAHNYYKLVRAGGGVGDSDSDPFPGSDNVTALTNSTKPANLLSWTGKKTQWGLGKISEYGAVIAFDLVEDEEPEEPYIPDDPGQCSYGMKYWFDDQHEQAGQVENFKSLLSFDVSGLSEGLHALHVTTYVNDENGYQESSPQTMYFFRKPMLTNGRPVEYTFFIDNKEVGHSTGTVNEDHQLNIPMAGVGEGLHQLTVLAKTTGETATLVDRRHFLRVATPFEIGDMHLMCSIDGATPTTLERSFVDGSLTYELNVKDLKPGMHSLKYQVINSRSTLFSPPTTAFFIVDPKLKSYEYWLNGDRSTLVQVGNLAVANPFEMVANLNVTSMPLRSKAFHFAVEEEKPVVYAVNDFTLRAIDDGGCYTDSTVQYIDTNTKEAITKTTLLEKDEPTTSIAPAEGKIKWYRLEAYRGDGILLEASRACTIHLFAPNGDELYCASGEQAKTKAGAYGRQTGTYYVAVHDISDGEESNEITVTYYGGSSILTAQPQASLPDGEKVYRNATVTLTCATPKAVIWYSTDGSEPSLESETTHRYDGKPITITEDMMLRAIATCTDMMVSDEAVFHYDTRKSDLRWDFTKRWLWISHNMADDLPASSFLDFAEYIESENESLSIINGKPVLGSMSPLSATKAWKVKSVKAGVMNLKLDMIDPTTVQMELHKGWNWIGYPIAHSQTLQEAFDGQAREGDIVCGQLGYAIYENGSWHGTLQTLDTGRGYLFMSKTNRVLTLRNQEESETQQQDEPFTSQYGMTVNIYSYPSTMNLTGQLYVDDQLADVEDFVIGAFCSNECRGIAEAIGDCYYLTVYGNDDDFITLKAVKRATLEAYNVTETFTLSQQASGTPASPLLLHTDLQSTGIKTISISDKFNVYTAGGLLIKENVTSLKGLPRGIYVIRSLDGKIRKKISL